MAEEDAAPNKGDASAQDAQPSSSAEKPFHPRRETKASELRARHNSLRSQQGGCACGPNCTCTGLARGYSFGTSTRGQQLRLHRGPGLTLPATSKDATPGPADYGTNAGFAGHCCELPKVPKGRAPEWKPEPEKPKREWKPKPEKPKPGPKKGGVKGKEETDTGKDDRGSTKGKSNIQIELERLRKQVDVRIKEEEQERDWFLRRLRRRRVRSHELVYPRECCGCAPCLPSPHDGPFSDGPVFLGLLDELGPFGRRR